MRKCGREDDAYVERIMRLNDEYRALAEQIEEQRETGVRSDIDELPRYQRVLQLCTEIADASVGREQEVWLQRGLEWEFRLSDLTDALWGQTKQTAADAKKSASASATGQKPEQADTGQDAGPGIREFSYSFCNSADDLYPGVAQPRIPLERFYQVFGRSAMAKMQYDREGVWGGSCFGFSTTSAMFSQALPGMLVSDFKRSAQRPEQLQIGSVHSRLQMKLVEYLEAMQISQYCKTIAEDAWKHFDAANVLDEICAAVEGFMASGKAPITIGVFSESCGHAVLPFRLERLNAAASRLHIYDPNWPKTTRFMDLECDGNGHYLNWRFEMFDNLTLDSKNGDHIDYNSYDVYHAAWENRGALPLHMAAFAAASGTLVRDEDEKEVLRITKQGVVPYRDDIIVSMDRSMPQREDRMVWMLPGRYVVVNEDGEAGALSLRFADTEQYVSLTTDAKEVCVCVDDSRQICSAEIEEADRTYTIELFSTLKNTYETVTLEGITGQNGVRLSQICGVLYAAGLDQLSRAALSIDGKPADVDALVQQWDAQLQEEQEAADAQVIYREDSGEKEKSAEE